MAEKKLKRIFHDTGKLYESQISVSVNDVELEHKLICLFIAFGCFLHQNRDGMAHTAYDISYLALYRANLPISGAVLFS